MRRAAYAESGVVYVHGTVLWGSETGGWIDTVAGCVALEIG